MEEARITVVYNGLSHHLRAQQVTVPNLCLLCSLPQPTTTKLFLRDPHGNVEFDVDGTFQLLRPEVLYAVCLNSQPTPGTPILPTTDLSGLQSGCYTFQVAIGQLFRLWLDNDEDGGSWVLIHKTDKSSSADLTDNGCNIPGLESNNLDAVSVLPRATIHQMGSIFRVQSCLPQGYKLFWKGKSYYTTDTHPAEPAREWIEANIHSKYSWNDAWKKPCEGHTKTGTVWGTSAQHGFTMWGPSGAHFCASRWCSGADPGIHFNQAPQDPAHPWGPPNSNGVRLSGSAWVKWGSPRL